MRSRVISTIIIIIIIIIISGSEGSSLLRYYSVLGLIAPDVAKVCNAKLSNRKASFWVT